MTPDASRIMCKKCRHAADAHTRMSEWDGWANNTCRQCADPEFGCSRLREYVVWLAAGRPTCANCRHADYYHEPGGSCGAAVVRNARGYHEPYEDACGCEDYVLRGGGSSSSAGRVGRASGGRMISCPTM